MIHERAVLKRKRHVDRPFRVGKKKNQVEKYHQERDGESQEVLRREMRKNSRELNEKKSEQGSQDQLEKNKKIIT